MREKVSVVGLGKAGLPLAVVLAEAGHEVLGVDVNQHVVDTINRGECPIKGETGLLEMIKQYHGVNFSASSDPLDSTRKTRVHILIVPLLTDENHNPDFRHIDAAVEGIGKGLKKGDLVVLETSVPVGTTSGRVKSILKKVSGLDAGSDFHLAYSPERIMTGYSISRFKEFPKIVGGINEKSTDDAFRLYSSFCSNVTKVDNLETAELTKLAEGVYRDVNIALANELLTVCEEYGIDFWKMRNAANHPYCNIHEAGCGVSGHCIPVYPHFIINDIRSRSRQVPLTSVARHINDGMAQYFHNKVVKVVNGKKGSKVAIVGLAFREGVDETFYTRSKALINLLKGSGFEVYGIDPMLSDERIRQEFNIIPHDGVDFSGFDCIVVVNKNLEYKDNLLNLKDKIPIIDCKNTLGIPY